MGKILLFSLLISSVPSLANETIVIDPGHMPTVKEKWGAMAVCDVDNEAHINGLAADAIRKGLNNTKAYQVLMTREPGADVRLSNASPTDSIEQRANKDLDQRAAITCQSHADMFISIHHDDTINKNKVRCDSGSGSQLDPVAFRNRGRSVIGSGFKTGFQVFVSPLTPGDTRPGELKRYNDSVRFAKIVEENMEKITGRTPSNHHLDKEDCQSCVQLARGVMAEKNRALRKGCAPGILIEVGVTSDRSEYNAVVNDAFRGKLERVIQKSLADYFAGTNVDIPVSSAVNEQQKE